MLIVVFLVTPEISRYLLQNFQSARWAVRSWSGYYRHMGPSWCVSVCARRAQPEWMQSRWRVPWWGQLCTAGILQSAAFDLRHCRIQRPAYRQVGATLFCSLAVLDLRVGHTMYVLSPFIPVLCHSDWLFHGESCRCLDVHPGRACSSSPAYTWHCSLHSLSPGNSLVSSWCGHSMLASLLWRCLRGPFYCSFVIFAVHETRKIFLSPFISKASRRVSSFWMSS